MRKVEVVPHNPAWKIIFQTEASLVKEALGETVMAVHHIGSTAIPGIHAKPIIDLLVEVQCMTQVDARSSSMEQLGYEVMGEFGISGRRFFRKNNRNDVRTHHIHLFNHSSAQVKRHLAFRDYMIAHPTDAKQYSDLKRQLAHQYPTNIDGYMDGKDSFIKAIDVKAGQWNALQTVPQSEP
ncbi:GrpB family protein [Acaryochloris marina]|uniref:GrpB family protein n=1 Tax=Acaryochloris marina TaxID=155978 RepID=UPI0021C29EFB|nr:GrpB family protein [Acaryochloris marina]BDM82044.1 hypothetical protein AM10699_49080 [Acaryochloris marina MBIC10699]